LGRRTRREDTQLRIGRLLRDQSGQILRHVITVGIIIAVIVLVLVEVGPIVWLRISSVQDAEDIVDAAVFQYRTFNSVDEAIREVTAKMKTMGFSDEEIRESQVLFLPLESNKKTSVRVTIVRYANTLVTRHINALKKLSRVATTKEGVLVTPEEQQQQQRQQ
jgi:ABC-type glycerol-3-phosphate transport system permease component